MHQANGNLIVQFILSQNKVQYLKMLDVSSKSASVGNSNGLAGEAHLEIKVLRHLCTRFLCSNVAIEVERAFKKAPIIIP